MQTYKPGYRAIIVSHYAILWEEYIHTPLQNTEIVGVSQDEKTGIAHTKLQYTPLLNRLQGSPESGNLTQKSTTAQHFLLRSNPKTFSYSHLGLRIQFDGSRSGANGQESQAGTEAQCAWLMGKAMLYSLHREQSKMDILKCYSQQQSTTSGVPVLITLLNW